MSRYPKNLSSSAALISFSIPGVYFPVVATKKREKEALLP